MFGKVGRVNEELVIQLGDLAVLVHPSSHLVRDPVPVGVAVVTGIH